MSDSYIIDAFKALEDLDDELFQPKVQKLKEGASYRGMAYYEYNGCKVRETPSCFVAIDEHGNVIGESKTRSGAEGLIDEFIEKKEIKEEKIETIDISGSNMYERGQAYYYARTGDHVDVDGKKYEIILDKDGGHKIGYSDTLLLKDLESGEEIEISKKDFIEKAQLLKEECEVKEAKFELSPEHDSRASFYGKAKVDVRDDGTKILYSYGTPVCRIEGDKATLLKKGYLGWSSSQTTLRHVKEFLKQNGFKAESMKQMAKDYEVEQAKVSENLKDESINEGISVNIMDEDEVEEGKEFLNHQEEEHIEQVVDVDAETVEELKDSYLGNVILRCPSCKTMIYKKPELLEKDGEGDIYNVGETCPHCGSKDGFELVGQVASLDIPTPEESPTTGQDNIEVEDETVEDSVTSEIESEEPKEEEDVEIKKTSVIADESLEKKVIFEGFDSEKFDTLVNKYLVSTYNNVDSYTSTKGTFEDGKMIVEGTLKFKSGKEKATSFVLDECKETKGGKFKLSGINETFSNKKAFNFVGTSKNNELVCESLSYKYDLADKKISGKVMVRQPKRK